MVTAHPHPRAPQQRGLAPLAARRGGGLPPRPARTHLGCPGCHSNRGRCEVRSRETAKGSLRYPFTLLIHQQRTLDWIQRGILGCPRFRPQSLRKKRQSRGPREPGTWKGISLSPACPPPPAEPKAGAGSRKLRKDREVRRPHSGAVITGTCPSRPRLPLSLSHFFPCWKVPVP